jgi:hypothetical protein
MTITRISEQQLVDELERGSAHLLADAPGRVLVEIVRRKLQTATSNLFIVHWIPEQEEDLYDVLVDGTSIVHVEIPRGEDRETVCEVSSIEQYAKLPRTKPDRRKLEAAIQLARALSA